MTQKVLSYDLGGTKIAAGVVNNHGRIIQEIRVPALFREGKQAVLMQLTELGTQLLSEHLDIKTIGIASAGPLDGEKGILLDPTNFANEQGSWGNVPITRILQKKLKRPAFLENDAAASVLAERWKGAAKGYSNSMVLTLGTGLGTGIICNGELVKAGRKMHPEAGHIILRQGDFSAPCGCGNLGCAEAFLSGRNFAKRISLRMGKGELSAKDLADLARKKDAVALAAFAEYAELMAAAIFSFARIYCPEIIIFTGSFAEASDLFLASTKKHLQRMLVRAKELIPRLEVSSLNNEAGLIGGAYVAFNQPPARR